MILSAETHKKIILGPQLVKFGESEGHLELSWALNRDPRGPWGPQLVQSGSKWTPNGANKDQGGLGYGPQEPKLSQKSPNITCWCPKMRKEGTKKEVKSDKRAIMHVF